MNRGPRVDSPAHSSSGPFSSQRLTYTSALVLLLWIVFVTVLIWMSPREPTPEAEAVNHTSSSGTAIDMLP